MLRASTIRPAGDWDFPPADWAQLDYDQRRRRRRSVTARNGLVFLLDLPAVTTLRDGDGLVLDDGRIIGVRAAPEALLEITCRDPRQLARIAWHLGNRHLPAEIRMEAIRIRSDHVIADMARGLGAAVESLSAPFNPEQGAYSGNGASHHHHDHGHGDHDHHHDHPHDHDHVHA